MAKKTPTIQIPGIDIAESRHQEGRLKEGIVFSMPDSETFIGPDPKSTPDNVLARPWRVSLRDISTDDVEYMRQELERQYRKAKKVKDAFELSRRRKNLIFVQAIVDRAVIDVEFGSLDSGRDKSIPDAARFDIGGVGCFWMSTYDDPAARKQAKATYMKLAKIKGSIGEALQDFIIAAAEDLKEEYEGERQEGNG